MDDKTLPYHLDNTEQNILSHMPSADEITEVSNAMKQLGDPSRLQIFWLLCHCEKCVQEIASLCNMTSPAVSHHLRLLKGSKLISSRREGKEMYYHSADNEIAKVLHHTIEQVAKVTCPEESKPVPKETSTLHPCDEKQAQIIKEIHTLLTENMGKRYTIDELSKRYLLNTSTLKDSFKAVYGMPIATYMKQYRIHEAAKMLKDTNLSIAEISAAVGYENQSKFTNAFKNVVGIPPTAYRKSC